MRAPNPSGRRRVAVRRLTREFDLPFRKGCPGRPRARQIGRSDAEFLRKYCVSFVLFFTSPLCFNRDRLVTRRATQRPPAGVAQRRYAGTRAGRRGLMTEPRTPSPDTTDERPRRNHAGTAGWDTNKRLMAGHVRERRDDHVNVPTAPGAGHEE